MPFDNFRGIIMEYIISMLHASMASATGRERLTRHEWVVLDIPLDRIPHVSAPPESLTTCGRVLFSLQEHCLRSRFALFGNHDFILGFLQATALLERRRMGYDRPRTVREYNPLDYVAAFAAVGKERLHFAVLFLRRRRCLDLFTGLVIPLVLLLTRISI